MKRISFLIIFLFFIPSLRAQEIKKPLINKRYNLGNDGSVFYTLQRTWVANESVSYASPFAYVQSIGSRRIGLKEGEGKSSNFHVVEANLNLHYVLLMGRENMTRFWRSMRLTFDYNSNFRMVLDESKPILPGNNRVGVGLNLALYNSCSGWINQQRKNKDHLSMANYTKDLFFINSLIQIHHYSNGQPSGFYYYPNPADSSFFRNDYTNGDFSTNYIYPELTFGVYGKEKNNLIMGSVGFRFDLGSEKGVFAYTKEQEGTYGRKRIFLKFDWRSGPKRGNKTFVSNENKLTYSRMYEWHFRSELIIITDNLDQFQANLMDETRKFRLGTKTLLELAPLVNRSAGYFLSFYFGRDYLSVRYDDIVFSIQGGLTLSLDKYYPPNWKSGNSYF